MRRLFVYMVSALLLVSCGTKNGDKQEEAANVPTGNNGGAGSRMTPAAQPPGVVPGGSPAGGVNANGLTIGEQNGIDEVKNFYGGNIKFSAGSAKEGKKYFRIEISNSGSLDSTQQIAELSASNIALLFYKDLQQERTNYSEIRTVILYTDRQKLIKSYPVSKLEIVLAKMVVLQKIGLLLKDKKYDSITPLLNDKSGIMKYDRNDLIAKLKHAESSLGAVKDFVPYGFIFVHTKDNKQVLHISGVLLRDTKNTEFSVDFDPASKKEEAIFLNYKL